MGAKVGFIYGMCMPLNNKLFVFWKKGNKKWPTGEVGQILNKNYQISYG